MFVCKGEGVDGRGAEEGRGWERGSPLIMMHLQLTNICSVCIGILYLISKASPWNTYNTLLKQSKRLSCDLKPDNKKSIPMVSNQRHW